MHETVLTIEVAIHVDFIISPASPVAPVFFHPDPAVGQIRGCKRRIGRGIEPNAHPAVSGSQYSVPIDASIPHPVMSLGMHRDRRQTSEPINFIIVVTVNRTSAGSGSTH